MIKINALNKFYGKGKENEIHVLNDVTIELPERGMTAIFGKSGCGKTTLLNVLGGLDSFHSGEVLIDGKNISKDTDDLRNRYVGYIFQNYNLALGESCYENVAAALRLSGLSDEEEIRKRVSYALKCVDMENYAGRNPETLSGGQQQRIAIARAIVKNPKIILADEPTGNLDEANTVMIMDLLRQISKEHLVVLVTHEANLVDYYCDTVIELSDGKVISERRNAAANGFYAKDKNDIYLGELEKSELSDTNATVEYYGTSPASPIRLKIINSGGRIYVSVDSKEAQIIDASSEIRLREGVYEEPTQEENSKFDTSLLPPVEEGKCGRLFTFASALKRGYKDNFGKQKRSKKVLRRCLWLFSSIIVIMSAVFGTAFKDIATADGAYNHNVFYVYAQDGVSEKLSSAINNEESGIDYVRLVAGAPSGDNYVYFRTGNFETFTPGYYSGYFGTNAVMLSEELAEELPLLYGKNTDLEKNEIVISSKVADALIEKSTLGYINERRDLIGLLSQLYYPDGTSPRIAGIVEADETAVYLPSLGLARVVNSALNISLIALASDYGMELKAGETLLIAKNTKLDTSYPAPNEVIKIQGNSLLVTAVKEQKTVYEDWLKANGIEKTLDATEYFKDLIAKENPTLDTSSLIFELKLQAALEERFYEFYDYLYTDIDAYLSDRYLFEPTNIGLWMYLKKDVELAKYSFMPDEYYAAVEYKKLHGSYPTVTDLRESSPISVGDEMNKLFYTSYENEFYRNGGGSNAIGFYRNVYLLSDEDYVKMSTRLGSTHTSAKSISFSLYDMKDAIADVASEISCYFLVHSTDPEKTEEWLKESFSDLTPPSVSEKALIIPEDIHEVIIKDGTEKVVTNLIAITVILTIMCVCVFLIMRSSLMSHVKETGIQRAIGVSKKNLIFKFFIEASLLAVMTVLVGYLISSAFVYACYSGSSLMSMFFYYPIWLALSVLAVVFSATVFFGILPVILLLRKTPSEILTKYDI